MNKSFPAALILVSSFFIATQAYAAEPVAHWRFDEGSGTTATDSSGNGRHGTISGATYSANVPPNLDFANPYSLEFDGINDGVSTPLSVSGLGQFTISGWAYPRSAQAGVGWFGANDAVEFIFQDSTTLRCWTAAGAVNWSFAGNDNFLNSWHHITCLGDGNNIILYVDGAQVASTTHAFTSSYGSGDNFSIGIGVQNGGTSGPFDGFIDDVRVYDVALTPQEMSSLGTGADEPVDSPVASAFSPVDDAMHVATSSGLAVTFNKNVEWAFNQDGVRVYRTEDDTLFFAQSGGGGSGTSVLTLAFSMNFEYETEYYVIIDPGAVIDLDGNPYAGVTASSTWSFTTEKAPEDFGTGEIPESSIYKMLKQAYGEFEGAMWTSVAASSDGSRLVALGSGYLEEAQGPAGFIYTSINGGKDWQLSTSSEDFFLTSVVSSADGMSIMAVGLVAPGDSDSIDFIVVKSANGGQTWNMEIIHSVTLEDLGEIADNQFIAYMLMYLSRITASSDLSNVHVALFDKIIHSSNGGEDWNLLLDLGLANESLVFPLSISSSADGSKVLLAMSSLPVIGGSQQASVILSSDHGQSWTPVMTSDDGVMPFSVTVSKDGNRLFIVDPSSKKIHISNDNGASWTASANPDSLPWMYVAPSATGEGIVASAIRDMSEEHDDGLYWYRTLAYSSSDNGLSWTKRAESEEASLDGFISAMFGQLVGNISGSYSLSHLGLVAFAELFVITQEEPALPAAAELPASRPGGSLSYTSSVYYGCGDARALNYAQFARHDQASCRYGYGMTPAASGASNINVSNLNIPALPSSAIPVRNLTAGMTGPDVQWLQRFLNASGFALASQGAGSPGNETAMFGALTRKALARYQQANGIAPAAGYFGPLTRAHMKKFAAAGAN